MHASLQPSNALILSNKTRRTRWKPAAEQGDDSKERSSGLAQNEMSKTEKTKQKNVRLLSIYHQPRLSATLHSLLVCVLIYWASI